MKLGGKTIEIFAFPTPEKLRYKIREKIISVFKPPLRAYHVGTRINRLASDPSTSKGKMEAAFYVERKKKISSFAFTVNSATILNALLQITRLQFRSRNIILKACYFCKILPYKCNDNLTVNPVI